MQTGLIKSGKIDRFDKASLLREFLDRFQHSGIDVEGRHRLRTHSRRFSHTLVQFAVHENSGFSLSCECGVYTPKGSASFFVSAICMVLLP